MILCRNVNCLFAASTTPAAAAAVPLPLFDKLSATAAAAPAAATTTATPAAAAAAPEQDKAKGEQWILGTQLRRYLGSKWVFFSNFLLILV